MARHIKAEINIEVGKGEGSLPDYKERLYEIIAGFDPGASLLCPDERLGDVYSNEYEFPTKGGSLEMELSLLREAVGPSHKVDTIYVSLILKGGYGVWGKESKLPSDIREYLIVNSFDITYDGISVKDGGWTSLQK